MKEKDNLNPLLKTFVKGSFIIFFGVFISKIATYLYNAIVARNFNPEVYGLFSLALMVFGIFVSIFSLGFPSGLLRYISFYRGKNEKEKIKSIFRFSLILLFFASVLGGILLFLFSETISTNLFHTSNLTIFLQWFAIFLPFSIFAGTFYTIILAYEKVGWFSFISNILFPVSQLIFLISFIFIGLKTGAIFLSHNLGFLVILLTAFFVCRHSIKDLFGKSNLEGKERSEINKKLLSYSWPIIFSELVMSLFSLIDSFTIGYFKNVSDVGIYNAAVPIACFLLIVPTLFLQLFLPVITKEYSKGNLKLIKGLSKQIGKWIFIINLPLIIIIILFPGAVINLLFGSAYIQAENSLRFLAMGFFFHSIFLISQNLLSMKGKSRITLLNVLITSVINLILNIILIPKYGINGAAFSTMLSYIILGLLSFFMAKHQTKINPLKLDMLKIILVAIIPTAILLYVRSIINISPLSIIITGVIFVMAYFAVIVLTHSLDKNDLMILSAIKKKIFMKK